MEEQTTASHLSMRDVLSFVFKYRSRMLWVFFSVFIAVAGTTCMRQPVFRSSAKIMIQIGRENIYTSISDNSPGLFDFSVDQRINSKVELLTGTNAVQRNIEALGITNVYPDIHSRPYIPTRFFKIPIPSFSGETDMERAILLFRKNLEAHRISKSDLVSVEFDHSDPVVAQKSLEGLIDIFIKDHVNLYQEGKRYNFLESQVQTLGGELAKAEEELEEFKSAHNISSIFQEKTILLEHRAWVEERLLETQSAISENQGKLLALESSDGLELGEETDLNPLSISELRRMLGELQIRETEYLNLYTEDNPMVKGVRAEIKVAEELLADEERAYHNKAKMSLMHTLDALRTKEKTLLEQYDEYEVKLDALMAKEVQLNALERKVSINEDNYKLYVEKLEESRIARAMDEEGIVNVSVVDPPNLPISSVKPNMGLGLAVAILLGILTAMLVAFYSEYFNHTMNSPEEVQRRTGLNVAVDLPDWTG